MTNTPTFDLYLSLFGQKRADTNGIFHFNLCIGYLVIHSFKILSYELCETTNSGFHLPFLANIFPHCSNVLHGPKVRSGHNQPN